MTAPDTLQERLKQDLKTAMKEKNEAAKNAIRIVMGEFGRVEGKTVSDDETIRILKKLISSEKETLAARGEETSSEFITVLEAYLPQMAGEEEIRAWVEANVDFSQYKNKMQAMKDIMGHFGASADGNTVKGILQSF